MVAPHPTSCSSALKNCKRERSQHREKRSGTKRERETHTHTCTDLVQELLVPPSQALVLRCPLLAGGGHAVVSTEGGVELTLHAGVNLRRDGVAIEQVVLLLNLEGSRHVLKHHAVAVEGAGLGVPDFGLQSGGHSFVDHRLVLPLLRLLELVLEGRDLLLELGDLTRPPLGLLKPLLDSRDGPLRLLTFFVTLLWAPPLPWTPWRDRGAVVSLISIRDKSSGAKDRTACFAFGSGLGLALTLSSSSRFKWVAWLTSWAVTWGAISNRRSPESSRLGPESGREARVKVHAGRQAVGCGRTLGWYKKEGGVSNLLSASDFFCQPSIDRTRLLDRAHSPSSVGTLPLSSSEGFFAALKVSPVLSSSATSPLFSMYVLKLVVTSRCSSSSGLFSLSIRPRGVVAVSWDVDTASQLVSLNVLLVFFLTRLCLVHLVLTGRGREERRDVLLPRSVRVASSHGTEPVLCRRVVSSHVRCVRAREWSRHG